MEFTDIELLILWFVGGSSQISPGLGSQDLQNLWRPTVVPMSSNEATGSGCPQLWGKTNEKPRKFGDLGMRFSTAFSKITIIQSATHQDH